MTIQPDGCALETIRATPSELCAFFPVNEGRRAVLDAETAAADATSEGLAEAGRTKCRAAGKRRYGAQSGRPVRSEAGRGGGFR